jgi:hypothetical protein
MKIVVSLLAIAAVAACGHRNTPPISTDAPPSGTSSDAPNGAPFRCTPTCSDAQFCYAGAETGFWDGPGTISIGCNPLPAGCTDTCGCVMQSFARGFCTCDDAAGVVIACSFV